MAPAIENVEVQAGSAGTVTMRLLPLAAPCRPGTQACAGFRRTGCATDRRRQPGWGWQKWTWVAAGSTVLLAAGAITAGVLDAGEFDSLRGSCAPGNLARPGCPQSDIDSVSSRQTAANVFWGLTAAAAVTTGVLFFVEGKPVSAAPMAGGATGLWQA